MGKIYSGAIMVLIWLGEHDRHTATAFHTLKKLAQGVTMTDLQHEAPIKDEIPESLLSVFQRPWFKRMWTIQEALLAYEPIVFCGAHKIPFDVIKTIAARHYDGLNILRIQGRFVSRHNIELHTSLRTHMRSYLRILHRFENQEGTFPWTSILKDCRTLKCKEPHDKIYGLLGLLNKEAGIEVDYDRTILDVYRDVALVYLARTDTARFLLLDSQRADFSCPDPNWPSWIPDWRTMPNPALGRSVAWSDTSSYNATLGSEPVSPTRLNQSTLAFKAYLFSVIEMIGETMDAYNPADKVEAQRDSRETIVGSDSKASAASRVVTQLRSWQNTLKVSDHDFWRIVLRNRLGRSTLVAKSQTPRIGGWRQMTDEDCHACIQIWHKLTKSSFDQYVDNSTFAEKIAFFQSLEQYLVDARPFKTISGHAGVGPCNIQSKDHIALIPGVRAPMILRPVPGRSTKYFWNISPCYVHGIMQGEALTKLRQEPGNPSGVEDVFEEIYIV